MLVTAGSWRWIVPTALCVVACGGSSSETPPPLPPHPLNKPYREPSAVLPKVDRGANTDLAEGALSASSSERDLLEPQAPSQAKSTWGYTAPLQPLPEQKKKQ